ncbi:MAG: acyclic terpene utilization AtuA family protein [Nitrospinota bacterium]|jgi:hypothetical protein
MSEVRVLAPNGVIGSGFLESSFEKGLSLEPHVIACDGGSTDTGAATLGSGESHFSRAATKRDLQLMIKGRDRLGVPLIVGSCGNSGSDIGLDWMRDICLEIAEEEGLRFRLALVRSEQDKEYLKRRLREGRIKPLEPAPELHEGVIDRSAHIVGMMGTEPISKALDEGAEVVFCGRSSDTALFSCVPERMGAPAGPSWHAGKILECGTACTIQRRRPDGVFAWIQDDHFVVEPLDSNARCTPQSVASHSLYENADPFFITEPGGVLDISAATYDAVDDRAVRVRGSKFQVADTYTVKLEGAEFAGYQSVIIGSIRDPFIIRQLDSWLANLRDGFASRVEEIFGGKVSQEDYMLVIRVYGKNGTMGSLEPTVEAQPHEVCLLFELTTPDDETGRSLATTLSHFALHNPIPEWHGLISTIAYPFAPAELHKGPAYRFNMNHVVEPEDPLEMFRFEYMEV